jgi:flagellar biosynthesis protein FlhF
MKIQRFTAPDMASALRDVRRELGPDAVILEAKTLSRDGGEPGVVVLAAMDRHHTSQPEAPSSPRLRALADAAPSAPRAARLRLSEVTETPSLTDEGAPSIEPYEPRQADARRAEPLAPPRPDARESQSSAPAAAPQPPAARRSIAHVAGADAELETLRGRVRLLNRLVASDHFSRIPAPLRELYLDLVASDVDSNLSFGLLQRLAAQSPDDPHARPDLGALRRQLIAMLPETKTRPGDRAGEVVFLIGPAGAGKTTIAGGLAARCLRLGLRPGLVSIDTFRAGGPLALEHYAKLLDVPCAAAFDPQDLTPAAGFDLSECDVLLVDTPALTPDDPEAPEHIARFRAALNAPSTQFVLPATAKVRDLAAFLERAARFDPAGLIFTKVDETATFGGLLSLSLKSQLPVGLLGTARRVADGLVEVTREDLVTLALGPQTAQAQAPARRTRAAAPDGPAPRRVRRFVPAAEPGEFADVRTATGRRGDAR